jgi:hypothetical protein
LFGGEKFLLRVADLPCENADLLGAGAERD